MAIQKTKNKIKNFLPSRKNNKHNYKQGVIDPGFCKKVITKNEPIIYRSSYELKFILWLEYSSDVVAWDSEPFPIKYSLGKRIKNYYPDFVVIFKDGSQVLIEVKPESQTKPPRDSKNTYLMKAWMTNTKKWKAANDYCESHNMIFKIITENTIDNL